MKRPAVHVVALALILAACSGSDGDGVSAVVATATATATSDVVPAASPDATTTAMPAATNATVATPTAPAAPVASAPSRLGSPLSMLPGAPITGAALDAELAAGGLTVDRVDRMLPCLDRGVHSARYVVREGERASQRFLVWFYDSPAALQLDWLAEPGSPPSPRDGGCVLDSGWGYWNENVVLYFEMVTADELRREVVDAFLALTP